MKRRRFVAAAAGATVASTLGACGGGNSPSAPTPPASPTPAAPANEVRLPVMAIGETVAASVSLVPGLDTPIAVTRLGEAEVVAVSRVCTHMGCTVGLPDRAGGTLDCPCHGSRFEVGGRVVRGPAARPLSSFPAAIRAGEVVVTIVV